MQPLLNLRLVVTRAVHQAEELAAPLRILGATVILLPLIGISPPEDPAPLRKAAANCHDYDWIIFTSANAVQAFAGELLEAGCHKPRRVAAIGPATIQMAEQFGFPVELAPEKYIAESLVDAFSKHNLQNCRILIPSAAVTREILPAELEKLGAQVDVVEAYRNTLPPQTAEKAFEVFQFPYPDWVLFASSSAVENLVSLVATEVLQKVRIATIGPATSQTVLKHRLFVSAEAAVYNVQGLVAAIVRHY